MNGVVHPTDAGRPVAVQQRVENGDWTDVGTVPSGSDGSFSVRWRATATGQVALREPIPGGATMLAASWYGPGMYGGKTACGQRLTPTLLGVAHRSLPCGTQVRLLYGGQALTVPVIDRGPYANGASFDLTKATADGLGADGVFSVGYAIIPV